MPWSRRGADVGFALIEAEWALRYGFSGGRAIGDSAVASDGSGRRGGRDWAARGRDWAARGRDWAARGRD